MKNYKTLVLLVLILISFFSCQLDYDDLKNIALEDNQFITNEDELVYLGCNDCNSKGNYIVNTSALLELNSVPIQIANSIDLSEFLPPIGNQGKQGSCASWSSVYYLKSFNENLKFNNIQRNEYKMSPSFVYNQITNGNCSGTSFEANLSILKNMGTCSIQNFPYNDSECETQPLYNQIVEAENYKINDYKYLSGQDMLLEMKILLMNQKPILIAVILDEKFGVKDEFNLTSYRNHTINYNSKISCHGMLVVGYDDTYNAFKVVNSWGENWGDDGFVWIDYIAFENVTKPDEPFRVICQAIVVEN